MIDIAAFVVVFILGAISGPFLVGSVIVGLFAASTLLAKLRGEI